MKKLDSSTIPKYENTINKLPVFVPSIFKREDKKVYHYSVDICEFYQQMLPEGYSKTKVWGYGGYCKANNKDKKTYIKHSPGPTFEVTRHIKAGVEWNNKISGPYMLPVDPTLYWTNPNRIKTEKPYDKFPYGVYEAQWPVTSVTHLHGGEVESIYDGHPDAWFTSNGIKGYRYTTNHYKYLNEQPQTTLWYHDNSKGVSRLSIYSGLCGLYIINEEKEESPFPSGKYDIPLIIQDKSFYEDGSIYYTTQGDVPSIHPYWVMNFYGDMNLVNGKVWPNLNVENQLYRFRILNASNARPYALSLSNDEDLIQIGTDGGYVNKPRRLKYIEIYPGERVDILVDFSKCKMGEKIILANLFSDDDTKEIMQFTINEESKKISYNIPSILNFIPKLTPDTKKVSTVILDKLTCGNKTSGMSMNGQLFRYPPNTYTLIGSTFEWDFINVSMNTHSIHLHLVQYQIVGRQQINSMAYIKEWIQINGEIPLNKPNKDVDIEPFLVGDFIPVDSFEEGWKDTAYVPSGYLTRIIVRYAPLYASSEDIKKGKNIFPFEVTEGPEYVYNSTILEGEDNDMMLPQIIIEGYD